MGRLVVIAAFCIAFLVNPAWGKTLYMPEEEIRAEALRGFEEILDLWRDGRYAELYDRTVSGGKVTRESFAERLSSAPRRPACCWEKMQEAKVTLRGDSAAVVRARLGFEGGGATEFKTRSFKLVKEDEVWRISQSDLISLAGAAKKKSRQRAKKKDSHN